MINVFGPYPYPAPSSPSFVWGLLTVGLLALAMTASSVARRTRRRLTAVILAVVAAVLMIPIVMDMISARTTAFEWQGRYTLPLAVGIPILAAYALGNDERLTRPTTLRLTAGVTAFVLAAEQVHVFVWTMHRYMVGTNGPLDFLSGPWQPPAPPGILIAAFVVGSRDTWRHVVCADRLGRGLRTWLIQPRPGAWSWSTGHDRRSPSCRCTDRSAATRSPPRS